MAVKFYNQLKEDSKIILEHFKDVQAPMQSSEKEYFLGRMLAPIFAHLGLKHQLVGGMRRVKQGQSSTHHDIDVLVTLSDANAMVERRPLFKPQDMLDLIIHTLKAKKYIIRELRGGIGVLSGGSGNKQEEKKHVSSLLLCRNETGKSRRVDIFVCPPEHWPFALLGWSGSVEMEKSWKHFTKHSYEGRHGDTDEHGRVRKMENQCRWYLSNSRLSYVEKGQNKQVLDQHVIHDILTLKSERDILRELGLPWLETWQRCA